MRRWMTVVIFSGIICSWVPGTTVFAQQKFRIGTGIDPVYSSYYVAEALGLYKKYGVDAELKLFSRGGEALDALMAGEMHATSNAEYPNIIAIDKNPEVIIIGVSCVATRLICGCS